LKDGLEENIMNTQKNARAWVVGISACVMGVFAVLPTACMSIFIPQIAAGIGQSVGAVSLMMSISAVGGMIASLLIGKLFKAVNTKLLIAVSGVLSASSLLAIGLSQNITIIYITSFLQGLGLVWSGLTMAQIIIAQWFIKARGTMMSLNMILLMVFAAIFNPLLARFSQSLGYAQTALGFGILIGAVIILIGLFIMVDRPEKIGMKPYGFTDDASGAEDRGGHGSHGGGAQASLAELSLKQAVKTPAFWMIMLVCLLGTTVAQSYGTQAFNFFQSIGCNPDQAGLAIAVNSLVGLAWTMSFGAISDKKSPTLAALLTGIAVSVAFLFNMLWVGFIGAIIAAALIAAVAGLSALFGPTSLVRLYGRKDGSHLIGLSHVAGNIGNFIGPVLAGAFFDIYGNYKFIYTILGCVMVVVVVLAVLIGSKKSMAKIKAIAGTSAEINPA
jgi:MFS family permease